MPDATFERMQHMKHTLDMHHMNEYVEYDLPENYKNIYFGGKIKICLIFGTYDCHWVWFRFGAFCEDESPKRI